MKFLDKAVGIVRNRVELLKGILKGSSHLRKPKSYLSLQFSDLQIQFIQMLVHKGDESLKYKNNAVKGHSAGQQFNTCSMNSTQKRICTSEESVMQFLKLKSDIKKNVSQERRTEIKWTGDIYTHT